MMKNKLFYVFFILFLNCSSYNISTRNISCTDELEIQYDNKRKRQIRSYPKADKKSESFIVYFLHDFKDSIQGYVNNKLYYNKKIKIDSYSRPLSEYFGYNYSKDIEIPVLKIVSRTRDICFDIEIDKKYKIIYVFITSDNKWIVRFSNYHYID